MYFEFVIEEKTIYRKYLILEHFSTLLDILSTYVHNIFKHIIIHEKFSEYVFIY